MADIQLNGAAVLIKEIEAQLEENKRLTPKDKLMFRSLSYLLVSSATTKATIEETTKKSVGVWIAKHPQGTIGIVVLFIIVQKSLTPILMAFGVPHEIALLVGG